MAPPTGPKRAFHPLARGRAETARRAASGEWLWGWHAVTAALENPAREVGGRLFATPERARALSEKVLPPGGLQVLPSPPIGELFPAVALPHRVALPPPPP